MTTPETNLPTKIKISEDNFPKFERRFAALVKTAAKLDVPAPTFAIVGEVIEKRTPRTDEDAQRIAEGDPLYPRTRFFLVTVGGEAPKIPGFRFIGSVSPSAVAGVNFVGLVPAARDLNAHAFTKTTIECDHCQKRRTRAAVYLIESTDTGKIFKIGKSCLKDFTGHKSPEAIARFADVLLGLDDEDWESFSGSTTPHYGLHAVLAMTAACTDVDGWQPAAGSYPTKQQVFDAIEHSGPYARSNRNPWPVPTVTPEHVERAAAALAWARSLSADPVIAKDAYLLNLRLAVEPETITQKRAGLVVSVFRAHAHALAAEVKLTQRAKEQAEAKPIPEFAGRVEIEGTITSATWRETDYGPALKIVIRHADGWALWGTCPASLGSDESSLIGRHVKLVATVEASRDKPSFGFFKRPSKATVVAA